jgi:hypothetical protein
MERLLDFCEKTVVVFIFDVDENQERVIRLGVVFLPVLLELGAIVAGRRAEQEHPWACHEACAQKQHMDDNPNVFGHNSLKDRILANKNLQCPDAGLA